jgi:hypothetical protein
MHQQQGDGESQAQVERGIIYFTVQKQLNFMEPDKIERRKIAVFDIAIIILILAGMTSVVHIYNKTAGTSCDSNFDCEFHCPAGSFNHNFIDIYKGPLSGLGCSEGLAAICEDAKCKTYNTYGASSAEECARAGDGFNEFLCLLGMAKKEANASYCDQIQKDFDRSYCYFEIARTTSDLGPCSGISDAGLKEACINELIEAPPDYHAQDPYTGDCDRRPEHSVCLSFSDGYTWLVFDAIINTEMREAAGYRIEIDRGEKYDYYHILYTDFVKDVEK